jgi:uncharacterized protein with GYD domain
METATIIKTGHIRKAIRVGKCKLSNLMKKYLVKGRYTSDGTKGLIQEGGSSRKIAIEKMLAEMDGKVESFYYAFGEDDVYVIVELPDDISGVAVILKLMLQVWLGSP